MEIPARSSPRRGRPRSFDEGMALDRAMTLFWQKGYDGASVDDLAGAMGITPPSLYAAFGNKESLFLQALQRYSEGPGCFVTKSLEAPTAREVAAGFLYGAVEAMCNPDTPPGCLATQTAALLANQDSVIGRKVLGDCREIQEAYTKRFERAKAEGDLPKEADAGALARYVYTVCQGLAVQAAASGATREQLRAVVETALRQWPS